MLDEFCATHENAHLVKLNGHDWPTYERLLNGPYTTRRFPPNYPGLKPKTVPPEEGLNTDLLVVGNIQGTVSQRLTTQFINSVGLQEWVQQFGRVRFLLWMPDLDKERLLPRSIPQRLGPSVISDAFCQIREICSSGKIRTGKGFQAETVVFKPPVGNIDRFRKKVAELAGRTDKWAERIAGRESLKLSAYATKNSTVALQRERDLLGSAISMVEKKYYPGYEDYEGRDLPLDVLRARWHELSENLPSTTKLEPTPPDAEPRSYIPTPEEEESFLEYEDHFELMDTPKLQKNTFIDEAYARNCDPPLLQSWREYNAEPFTVKPSDFVPNAPLALLDFQPRLIDEYLRPDNADLRSDRIMTFSWMVRTLYNSRSKRLKSSLGMLAPGGENILEGVPGGEEMGRTRVRCLTESQMVLLLKAWDEWEFKPEAAGTMSQRLSTW